MAVPTRALWCWQSFVILQRFSSSHRRLYVVFAALVMGFWFCTAIDNAANNGREAFTTNQAACPLMTSQSLTTLLVMTSVATPGQKGTSVYLHPAYWLPRSPPGAMADKVNWSCPRCQWARPPDSKTSANSLLSSPCTMLLDFLVCVCSPWLSSSMHDQTFTKIISCYNTHWYKSRGISNCPSRCTKYA